MGVASSLPVRLCCGCVLLLTTVVTTAGAVERSQQFLERLRERGLFDVALDYLEQQRGSRLANDEFKAAIDFERGVTLIAAAHAGGPAARRTQQLSDAQESLKRFLAAKGDHPLASAAHVQLANVLFERGRIKFDTAQQPGKSPADQNLLQAQARQDFVEAGKAFGEAQRRLEEALAKFPKVVEKPDPAQVAQQEVLRRQLLHVRLLQAAVEYEMALANAPGSAERRSRLDTAATRYNALFKQFPALLVGLTARLEEARCYKDQGNGKRAIATLAELLDLQEDLEPFRLLRNKAHALAVEAAMLPGEKGETEAIARWRTWSKIAKPADEDSAEGRTIKFFAAYAWLEVAKKIPKAGDPQREEALATARRLLTAVARWSGPYQAAARKKLAEPLWSAPAAADGKAPKEPTNFAEAQQRGQEALDRLQTLEASTGEAPGSKPLGEQQKRELRADARDEAGRYLRMALGLAVKGTTAAEEIAQVRYQLAYLAWLNRDYYSAAVLGEFLARKYPNTSSARAAAKIALAAYVKLFTAAPPMADRSFESRRLVALAEYIAHRWPDQPEAEDAWQMLIRTALLEGTPEKALAYLNQLPADSPRRTSVALSAGEALWASYLQALTRPAAERPTAEELDKLLSEARKVLDDGLQRSLAAHKSGPLPANLVSAALALAQMMLVAGEAEQAVKLLEQEDHGPLALLDDDAPGTRDPALAVEIYKTALRAYVAHQQLDKAERVMNALEKLVTQKGDARSIGALTQIYVGLGRELQNQLDQLRKDNKPDMLRQVSKGFDLFLTRIAARPKGNTFGSLSWVGDTFYTLGGAATDSDAPPDGESLGYLRKAVDVYRTILTRSTAEPNFAPNADALVGVRLRRARALRRLNQPAEAMDELVEVLKKFPSTIEVQIEAARTYQTWGRQKAGYYLLAIRGGRPMKQSDGSEVNLVWGWGKISKVLMSHMGSDPRFDQAFHEARVNLAQCRVRWADSLSGPARQETLDQADNDVRIVQRLFPELGGAPWQPKYNQVLQEVQRLRGAPGPKAKN